MAQGSQVGELNLVAALSGLMHNIFVGDVVPNVKATSAGAQLFTDAKPGQYRLEGSNLVGAVDFVVAQGALATPGDLPDHVYTDAVQWQTAPTRRYRRIAMDNHAVRRATGPGAFGDLAERITKQLWDSWKWMEIRHAYGDTNGYIGQCSSRTSSTVFVMKNFLGYTGHNPGMYIRAGTVLSWLDASSANAAEGAGTVSSLTYSTNTITVTMDSATTWEPGDQLAADDYIVLATTSNISTDYFATESGIAPHGLGSIIDPNSNNTTVLNISGSTYPQWKPYRQNSTNFDHIEVTEFIRKLRAKSTDIVNSQTHVMLCQGAPVAELARTLEGFNQQMTMGKTWEGGYQAVRIGQFEFLEDDQCPPDVIFAICLADLYRVNLGGDAHMWGEDGSQFSRLADYDGVEAFAVDYMQQFSPRRNRHGALFDIELANVNGYDFDSAPNY